MSVDWRTRHDGLPRPPFATAAFFGETLPAALDAHAEEILPAMRWIRPKPLTLDVGDLTFTLHYDPELDRVTIRAGAGGRSRVRLSEELLADLVDDQRTIMGMWTSKELEQTEGPLSDPLNWWLVLRAALDGTPIYTPGSIDFRDAHGKPLDLNRSFEANDDPDEMTAFLTEAGFLHIRGVFERDEMARISADMDRAAPSYTQGDGRSWWARLDDGSDALVRMQGFDRESKTAAALLDDDRFLSLASIPRSGHEFGRKRPDNRIEALFKPLGVVAGVSDIGWHKDCALGRHSYDCCGVTVGISVTGAGPTSGQLRVLAGSHRALVWSGVLQPKLDLPDVPLATETGDITMHLSCTMHMAQPPTERERRVCYSGFGLPSAPEDAAARAAALQRLRAVREQAPLTAVERGVKS